MRIIAGTARSRLLEAPEGIDTRPTLDRVREALFSMLQSCVPGARVLDLFAGSGALALEALSRGASHAVLCDRDARALRAIRRNIAALRFEDRCRVMACDCMDCLAQLQPESLDLVFLDPPYAMTDLSALSARLLPLLAPGAVLALEHARDQDPSVCTELQLLKQRVYGIAGVRIYQVNKE